MPESEKKVSELSESQKEEVDFVDALSKSSDGKTAEKLIKEKLDWGKSDIVAKNFSKIEDKIKDSSKLNWYVNKIESDWNLKSLSTSINSLKSTAVIRNIMKKVSSSNDSEVVKEFSKSTKVETINSMDSNDAKNYINNVDKFGCLQNIANWFSKIENKEVFKTAVEKVNDSQDSKVVTEFSKNTSASAINKMEPNNALWYIKKVSEKWDINCLASKIKNISNKEISKNIVNAVTEKGNPVALKSISKDIDESVIKTMDSKDLHTFARKSLMKGWPDCAIAMAWNKELMKHLDEGTSSLVKEYAKDADADNLLKENGLY